jgi:hypothetical protein
VGHCMTHLCRNLLVFDAVWFWGGWWDLKPFQPLHTGNLLILTFPQNAHLP